jgi:hypothetical protein
VSTSKWMMTAALSLVAADAATAGVGFSVGVAGRSGSFGFSYAQPGGYYHRPAYGGYYHGYYAPRVVYAQPQYVYQPTVVVPAPTYVVQPAPAPYPAQYPAPQYAPQYPAQQYQGQQYQGQTSPYPTTAPVQYPTSAPLNVPAAPGQGRVPPPTPQPPSYAPNNGY